MGILTTNSTTCDRCGRPCDSYVMISGKIICGVCQWEICSACHAELTHNSIVSTEPPSAEITDDEIEKIAEYIAQGSGYLSDFIHHEKSVKYGAIKGIEAMLDLLTNKVK